MLQESTDHVHDKRYVPLWCYYAILALVIYVTFVLMHYMRGVEFDVDRLQLEVERLKARSGMVSE